MTTAATREIELKLALRPADLPALRRHPRLRALARGRAETRRLRSVYFDTPDRALARRGIGLRVRRSGDRCVQTVKTGGASTGGLFERRELEAPVASERPELARVDDPELRGWLERQAARAPLEAVFETAFRRTRRRLDLDGTAIRFELDEGEVRAGGSSAPLCELELELIEGDPGALFDLALELCERVPLRPAPRSKADLGFALLAGEPALPRKARKLKLARDATGEDVWIATARGCLEQILANEHPAREGHDPEGVHQLRVGVRRLRAALSLFGPLLPPEQIRPLSRELRWLGGELGPARDLDVLLDETLEPLLRHFPDDGALKSLRDGARELRQRAYRRVRRALDSPRSPRLVLRLGRLLATRSWREDLAGEPLERLRAPAGSTGGVLLERRARKAHRLGDRLAELGVAERHRLRVQLKKLRYASEFFRDAYPGRRREIRRYLKRLEALQDTLGGLNDLATARRLLDEIRAEILDADAPPLLAATGFVAGWTASRAEAELEGLPAAWHAFAAQPAFWR